MSWVFTVAKKLSATALSQHGLGLDNDWVLPWSASRAAN
jgi:hypothetical protein